MSAVWWRGNRSDYRSELFHLHLTSVKAPGRLCSDSSRRLRIGLVYTGGAIDTLTPYLFLVMFSCGESLYHCTTDGTTRGHMARVKVTRKYQVTIPEEVRHKIGVMTVSYTHLTLPTKRIV